MNGSYVNIRGRQGGSGRLGHVCADRRYDVKGCLSSMYSGDRHATRAGGSLPSVSLPCMALPPASMLL
eukprot:5634367-Prymnesium_polylepis.1